MKQLFVCQQCSSVSQCPIIALQSGRTQQTPTSSMHNRITSLDRRGSSSGVVYFCVTLFFVGKPKRCCVNGDVSVVAKIMPVLNNGALLNTQDNRRSNKNNNNILFQT